MIQILISVDDKAKLNAVHGAMRLYTELFGSLFVEVCDPYCADLYIVDYINKEFIPNKTVLLGFEVNGYHSVEDYRDLMRMLQKMRLILNDACIEPQTIIVKSRRIAVNDIIVIETQGRNISVCTRNGTFSTYKTIRYWKKHLWMWPFIEVYRGILVNMEAVESYDTGKVYVVGGRDFPISRRKYRDVQAYMDEKETR